VTLQLKNVENLRRWEYIFKLAQKSLSDEHILKYSKRIKKQIKIFFVNIEIKNHAHHKKTQAPIKKTRFP
jgi:hypothetical protein